MTEYNEVKPDQKAPVDPKKEAEATKVEVEKRPKLKQIGHAKQKKHNVLERLVIGLIGPDGLPAIGHYLGNEVVMPAVKDIIANSLTTGIQMAIFGRDGVQPTQNDYKHTSRTPYYSSRTSQNYRPTTNYNQASNSRPTPKQQRGQDRAGQFNSEDYIMDDRNEALEALAQLQEYADNYNQVTLADFLDALGQDTQYTDNNYGWLYDDIMQGKVVMVRGGYALRLPRLVAID
jgi:hypothetical protein